MSAVAECGCSSLAYLYGVNMKKANRIPALILILSLVFSLFACNGNSKEEETTIPPETEASSDALEKFTDAAKELSERTSLFQDISIETKRSVGNHSYKERTERTADFIDLGSEAMMVSVSEKRTLDELEFTVRETYSAGKVYSEYGESGDAIFSAEIPAEDYLFRCLPSVIIDPELYGSVEYAKDDKSTVIFSDPDGLEDWLAPEYAKMILFQMRKCSRYFPFWEVSERHIWFRKVSWIP